MTAAGRHQCETTDELWQLALAKWAEIGARFPDLDAAVGVQKTIVRLLIDARRQLEDSRAPVPDIAADRILAKWSRGEPALRNLDIPIPETLTRMLPALCSALASESATHIGDALARGEIDAGSLLRVSLERDRDAIRTSSLHHGFSPDLVWVIGELASSPLANYCQARLLDTHELTASLAGWDRGSCPWCGSWPAVIEMVADLSQQPRTVPPARTLRCSYCSGAWALRIHRCVYCGNNDARFLIAVPEDAATGRLELCGACGSYTKLVDVAAPAPFPLIAIEDLGTMSLDEAAMQRGYHRPAMGESSE